MKATKESYDYATTTTYIALMVRGTWGGSE